MLAEEQTAPVAYGTLEIVCDGIGDAWCGKAVPITVDVMAGENVSYHGASCPDCGKVLGCKVVVLVTDAAKGVS